MNPRDHRPAGARRSFATCLFVLATFAACGNVKATSDAGVARTDAPRLVDAKVDAPVSGIHGLGQRCGTNLPDCAADQMCFPTADPNASYCTKICYSGTFTTDSDAGPITFPDSTPGDPACAAIYSAGPQGTPSCETPYNFVPSPPLGADTEYSVDFACAISCGAGDACPTGLHCDATICVP